MQSHSDFLSFRFSFDPVAANDHPLHLEPLRQHHHIPIKPRRNLPLPLPRADDAGRHLRRQRHDHLQRQTCELDHVLHSALHLVGGLPASVPSASRAAPCATLMSCPYSLYDPSGMPQARTASVTRAMRRGIISAAMRRTAGWTWMPSAISSAVAFVDTSAAPTTPGSR